MLKESTWKFMTKKSALTFEPNNCLLEKTRKFEYRIEAIPHGKLACSYKEEQLMHGANSQSARSQSWTNQLSKYEWCANTLIRIRLTSRDLSVKIFGSGKHLNPPKYKYRVWSMEEYAKHPASKMFFSQFSPSNYVSFAYTILLKYTYNV